MTELHKAVRDLPGPIAADLHEEEHSYLVVADVPGASLEGTHVDVTDEKIRVSAKRQLVDAEDATVVRRDRSEHLELELPVPADALEEAAEASLANGVLEIRLPRGAPGTDIPIVEE